MRLRRAARRADAEAARRLSRDRHLGFGEIIRIFLNNLSQPVNITNGPQGISRIDPLRAEGGKVDLRARMHLARASRRIDVFLRHGHLAAGLELRDGRRDIKLLRPEAWYESRDGFD